MANVKEPTMLTVQVRFPSGVFAVPAKLGIATEGAPMLRLEPKPAFGWHFIEASGDPHCSWRAIPMQPR